MSQAKSNMSTAAASRIQAAEARANGGQVAKGSFAARAQSTAARSMATNNPGGYPSKTGNPSGPGRTNNPPKSK